MTFRIAKALTRPALAASLAASLALTPITAAPARAGNDLAGGIAAASFFALLTAGLLSSSAASGSTQSAHPQPAPDRGWRSPDHDDSSRYGSHNDWHSSDRRKLLPSQCSFTLKHGSDRGTYFDRTCLVRNFDYWGYLPERCEEKVSAPGRFRSSAYEAGCLRRYGYREASAYNRH
jgi:hypothetical protein